MANKVDNYLKKIVELGKIQHALDLGAGDGVLSIYCAGFGIKVDSVDIKEPPAHLKNHPSINFWKSDLTQMTLERKKYDFIILRSILHLFESKIVFQKILPQVQLSLKTNGFLYLTTLTPPPESDKFTHLPEEIIKALPDLKLCALKEEKNIHKISGKKIIHSFWRLIFEKTKNSFCSINFE